MTTQEKIKLSFELEFSQTAERITFDDIYGYVSVGNKDYYCKLNLRGIKKNSWRLDLIN